MIRVNQFIINEKLIKFALLYNKPSAGECTRVVFLDNSEMIFEGMGINKLFVELEKVK